MKPRTRFDIFKRDGFTCRYCGKRSPEAILEIDHVLPVSSGGTDDLENLVTACYECNRGKGAKLLTDVPQELSFHEKAIHIAEQELQIAEYNAWKAKQKAREDDEIGRLGNLWPSRWAKHWSPSDVRKFLRKLGYSELEEIIELVNEKTIPYKDPSEGTRSWSLSAWKFFCGICWGRIKDRDDA